MSSFYRRIEWNSHLLALTGLSLIVHVKFAAGRDCLDVQLPRTISPALYFARKPVNWGRESGVSERKRISHRNNDDSPESGTEDNDDVVNF